MANFIIDGAIGKYLFDLDGLKFALSKAGGADFTLEINSLGGMAEVALVMHEALEAYPGKIRVEIGATCGGCAVVLTMAGDEIVVQPDTLFRLCQPVTLVEGNAEALTAAAERLDALADRIDTIVAKRTGRDKDEVLDWMLQETWFTAQEALAVGLCTEISGGAR